jgi:hypothetical protein
MRGRIAAVLLAAAFCFTGAAAAQETAPPPSSHREPSIGDAISVPLPNLSRRQRRRYEMPELSGAKSGNGSHLIDGSLPAPRIDYYSRTNQIVQRISIFSNGVVSITLEGAGANVRKKIVIPPDAVENYLNVVSESDLASVAVETLRPPDEQHESFIRRSTADGFVERRFHTMSILPNALQQQRWVLEDLMRVLAEDRQISSPLVDYEPRLGDHLISDDAKTYVVTRLAQSPTDGLIVELSCTREPVKIFVASKDLYNYFVAAKARPGE